MAIRIAGVDVINDDRELVLAKLTDINETINSTAVDVFIYDTSKDSDGGAWRHRTQHTSWYNETLDTDIRGIRKEFPSVAVIVAEEHTITIYDGDDPSLPMWMIFPQNRGALGGVTSADRDLTSVAMLNGVLVGGYGNGLSYVNFLSEVLERGASVNTSNVGVLPFNVSERDQQPGGLGGTLNLQIRNANVNDVAMTVLPDAPTDPATGLPVPTIAVATNGGVSVIKDDGTVVDITPSQGAGFGAVTKIDIDDTNVYFVGANVFRAHIVKAIPSSDTTFNSQPEIATDKLAFTEENVGNLSGAFLNGYRNVTKVEQTGGTSFAFNGDCLNQLYGITPSNSMVAYTTSTYTTGWMPGDIKLAALANSATADRSVNNNPLTQNGTITAAPVATGADLVAYSGFSSTNYLEQPYNPDLDFGQGDFCVMGWIEYSGANQRTILVRENASGSYAINLKASSLGIEFVISGGVQGVTTPSGSLPVGTWSHVCAMRVSGVLYVYINGALSNSGSGANSVTLANALLHFGWYYPPSPQAFGDPLALWRISATAPTAEQIAKIYEDERPLFQPNAKATLTGTSDAVTALAHDPDTNLLHVGTSGGRSVFYGLRRVNETATAVTTAISAVDGLIVEQ